ncbi:von Willebrand factor A domain-containing protein 5A-like isoform X4 [Hoplias malabaricus]|uniref:von Willebrand factor A domain-containing protein 5A-like isoform X4 n=1 Tax=Hoplias malabaricus TaxID=27720 RepID=UPI003461A187
MDSCGLITEGCTQVPLKSVEVEVQVKGFVATVTSTLQYVNEEESPVEATFVFPLPAEAAVCHFSVNVSGQEVVAEVHSKQKAREKYDHALSSGKQAFLLEESDESPDVFRLAVGSLPPNESATVTLIYVIELTVEADHGLRFCLPAVLNPRYKPSDMDLSLVADVTPVTANLVPYTLSLRVHIISTLSVSKVESNCSLEQLIYLTTDHTEAEVSLSPGHKFDRDVEILLYYQNAHQPTAIVEAGLNNTKCGSLMRDPVIMLSLYPEFPPKVASSFGKRGEFIFLMDQSGSMQGSSIISARETLLLLLKSLPLGCYFNNYGFGSHFQSFFPKSVKYTQNTMEEAMKKVAAINADMGGTELLKPLNHIYSQGYLPDHPRQVFVFTDGAVRNVKDILDLVRMHSRSHRCFTFGIGQGASTALVTGMAKEGGGIAQFIKSNDRLQLKVMQSLSFALQPSAVDITVKWTVPNGVSITMLSPAPKVLFQGQRAILYSQLSGKISGGDEGTVTVQYTLAEQPVINQLNFSLKPAEDKGLGIHRLAARTVIQSLEMKERETNDKSLRKKVVDLSVQSGVSSSFTAFLAVHKGSGQPVARPMVRRTVPVADKCSYYQAPTSRGSAELQSGTFVPREDLEGLPPIPRCMPALRPMIPGTFVPREDLEGLPPIPRCMSALRPIIPGTFVPREDLEGLPPPTGCDPALRPMVPGSAKIWGKKTQMKQDFFCMAPIRYMPEDGRYDDSSMAAQMSLGSSEWDMESSFDEFSLFGQRSSFDQKDSYLELISLQKAVGNWELETGLLKVFGLTEEELTQQKPAQVDSAVWVTVVALIWLHGFKKAEQEEWKFIAMKATSWIHSQKVGNLSECVQAGNVLLKSQVKEESLGL